MKRFMENKKLYYLYEIYDCFFANYILEQMGDCHLDSGVQLSGQWSAAVQTVKCSCPDSGVQLSCQWSVAVWAVECSCLDIRKNNLRPREPGDTPPILGSLGPPRVTEAPSG